jgi:hypothetical protein
MGTNISDGIIAAFKVKQRYLMPFYPYQLALAGHKLICLGSFNTLAHILSFAKLIVALSSEIVNTFLAFDGCIPKIEKARGDSPRISHD